MRHVLLLAAFLAPTAASAQVGAPMGAAVSDMPIFMPGDLTLESLPAVDGDTYPHDAAPLVRIGDGLRIMDFSDLEVEPALYHLDGTGEVLVDAALDVRTFSTFDGSVDWIRIDPVEPMLEGGAYRLRLVSIVDEEIVIDDDLDQRFTVDFTAGPTDPAPPVAPTPELEVIDLMPSPPTPWSGPRHDHRMAIHVDIAEADFGPHDTWLLFEVAEDMPIQADSPPSRWIDPEIFGNEETLIASWTYAAPEGDGRKCVQMAVEDAYGDFVGGDVVCADPVAEGCADAGCSAANSPGGSALGLLLALGLGMRRRRND